MFPPTVKTVGFHNANFMIKKFVENNSCLYIRYNNTDDTLFEIRTRDYSHIIGSYTKQYAKDLKITIVLYSVADDVFLLYNETPSLQMKITINDEEEGYVCFENFINFCEQNNIHDFDILFSTVYAGKLLHNFTLEERQYFIDHFNFREKDFDITVNSVYIEDSIKYKLYNKYIKMFEDYVQSNSVYERDEFSFFSEFEEEKINKQPQELILPMPLNEEEYARIYYWLLNSYEITEKEYHIYKENKFIINCQNNKDTFYIYRAEYDYIYIKCENVYMKSNEQCFYNYFNKNIVSQFKQQLELYKKLGRIM